MDYALFLVLGLATFSALVGLTYAVAYQERD